MTIVAMPAFSGEKTNPYNALLYRALIRSGGEGVEVIEYRAGRSIFRPHVLHLHWPDLCWDRPSFLRSFIRGGLLLAECLVRKVCGARIVWTAHNVRSHEDRHPVLRRLFWPALDRLVDATIILSESSRGAILEAHPRLRDKPMLLIPHGHYGPTFLPRVSREEARAFLGLKPEAKVLACFGAIRSYKAIPELIMNFTQIPDPDAVLLVAGSPADRAEVARIEVAAKADPRVIVRATHLTEEQLQRLVEAADVVALPYRSILNSGSVMYALSLGRRVLVMQQPAFDELRRHVGEDWVRFFSSSPTPADVASALATSRGAGEPDLSFFDWEPIARAHGRLFSTLLGQAETVQGEAYL